MSFLKWNRFRNWLKREYPELSIQRRKTAKDCFGWYLDNKIVVSNEIDEYFAIQICIHELAHHLASNKEVDAHDKWFGVGYYKAYKKYLEWE